MPHPAASKKPRRNTPIYLLNIELRHIKPKIYRRVIVPATISLFKLHLTIQQAMGWQCSHLHEFLIDDQRFGELDNDFPDDDLRSQNRVRLSSALKYSSSFSYLYDFGDNWEHKIKVEKTYPPDPDLLYPMCLDGANACPPEDVGGYDGYMDFVHAMTDPLHSQHADMQLWYGGKFEPTACNLHQINMRLQEIKL